MALAPNPAQNLTLGKGVLYFDVKDPATGLYLGARDLGNAPDFTLTVTPDKLSHYSSRGGMKVKDHEIVKELALGVSFTLDEPNIENLSMTFMAEEESVTQAIVTGGSFVIAKPKGGRYYNVGKKKITVTDGTETDTPTTTFVAEVDYTVDADNGRIYIVPGGACDDDTISITFTYNAAECTYTQLKALKQSVVEGRLQFVSDNPQGGNQSLEIWRTSLIPSGGVGFISDDWINLSYEGEVLKDEIGHPTSPYMSIDLGLV